MIEYVSDELLFIEEPEDMMDEEVISEDSDYPEGMAPDNMFEEEAFDMVDAGTGEEGFPCPVCGKYVFEKMGDYDICDWCGWENDKAQTLDPDLPGGANSLSLNEARALYKKEERS